MTSDHTEGSGRVGNTPRLDLDDRARLLDAIQALPALRAQHVRDDVVGELVRELGPTFLPDRDDAADVDARNIMVECIRCNSVHTLVKVLRVVLPPSKEFRHLADVVESAVPMQALTSAERGIIHEALADLPSDALTDVLVIEDLGLADSSAIDTADAAVAALESRVGIQPGAELALALFLEMAARQVDEVNRRRINQIVDTLGRRWGIEADVQAITRSAIDGYSRPLEPVQRVAPSAEAPPSGAILDPADDHLDSGDEVVKTIATGPTPEVLASVPEIMGGIPPQNPNFVGREAILEQLAGMLAQHHQATVLPTALHGLGGIGKSQLAAEYARRNQAHYQLIWWIPSNEERFIRRSLLSLARRLKVEESQDAQITVDTVLDTLRLGRPYADWLLIFDDAQDPAVVRQYMPSGPGQVLISSRNSSWRSSATALELDVFAPDESRAFLARRWPDLDDAQATALADRLGQLPLALEQAVAVHNETGMPLDEYLRLLDASPARILGEGEATEYPVSVAETWRLAFEKLSERSPAAAQLLEICAFLSSNPISVPMLARGRGATLPSPLAEVMRDDMKMRGAVRDIGRYSLAQLDPSRDFISIHMLVRAVLRDSMDDEQRKATERSAHELLALANPGQPENRATRAELAQIAPHVKSSGVLYSDDPHVRRVVLDVARYYFITGDYAESESLTTEAVENWRGRLGADDEMTLVACFHLGNARRALGDYRGARAVNQDTLERMTRVLGQDHEYTLRVANSSGADLRLLGEFEQAKTIDETNLVRCRATLGEEDPLTLRAASNLAVDSRLLGSYPAALKLDEEAYERRQVVLGDNNPEVLMSAVNLGRDLVGVGEYQEALVLAENTQSRYRALADHAYMLLARRNLAIILRFTGRYAESLAEATVIYDSIRREYGPRHEHAMSAAVTLFNTLRVCGQIDEAQRIGEETLDAYTAQLGAEHPFTLSCATDLAVIYRAVDRAEDAYERDRTTNEALIRALGPDHQYTLVSSNNMANNLALRRESAEALALSEQTYRRSVRVRGDDHPYSFACAANYALDLEAVGRHEEASRLRADTFERMRGKLGPEHPETVSMERGRRAESVIEVPPA